MGLAVRFRRELSAVRPFVWIQRACLVAGGSALGWCLLAYGEMALFQARESSQFDSTHTVAETALPARIVIPRIKLSAMVVEGADEKTLRRAVGHIPGTALPGAAGTVALAAHRDTFFRSVGRLRRNDEVVLQAATGAYRYAIVKTQVVGSEDTRVLRPSAQPSLVLVTCYPFGFVGHAPLRYVVIAHQVAKGD